jgi:hypothetical protein
VNLCQQNKPAVHHTNWYYRYPVLLFRIEEPDEQFASVGTCIDS